MWNKIWLTEGLTHSADPPRPLTERRHPRRSRHPQEGRLPGRLGLDERRTELYQRSYQLLISARQRADTCVNARGWCHFEGLRRVAAVEPLHCSCLWPGQLGF